MAEAASNWKKRYKEERDVFPFAKEDETLFLPIRHFNSDHPVTPGEWTAIPYNIATQPRYASGSRALPLQPALVGGGYYIWHKGTGIAIDPGHGFVDSLHRYHGITVHHIDVVIITHDHMDHHADLETIITLRRGGGSTRSRVLRIVTNQQVNAAYALGDRARITDPDIDVEVVQKGDLGRPIRLSNDITARFVPAAHWQRVRTVFDGNTQLLPLQLVEGHLSALGVQIAMKRGRDVHRVLITGDTLWPVRRGSDWFAYDGANCCPYCDTQGKLKQFGWVTATLGPQKTAVADRVQEFCRDMVKAYRDLDLSDVICLHVGSIERSLATLSAGNGQEIVNRIDDAQSAYTGLHLGLLGSLRVLRTLSEAHTADPTKGFDPGQGLVVLTEFGEELLGNRQNLCAVYKNLAERLLQRDGISVLPSEVTLRLRLDHANREVTPTQGVGCSYCESFHRWQESTAREELGEIVTYMASNPNTTHVNCAYWA